MSSENLRLCAQILFYPSLVVGLLIGFANLGYLGLLISWGGIKLDKDWLLFATPLLFYMVALLVPPMFSWRLMQNGSYAGSIILSISVLCLAYICVMFILPTL